MRRGRGWLERPKSRGGIDRLFSNARRILGVDICVYKSVTFYRIFRSRYISRRTLQELRRIALIN
jgi:hypothetical protein